jgi:glucokinase
MIIGIDLGGMSIKGGLINDSGLIIEKKSMPTGAWRKPQEIIKDIARVIDDLKLKAKDRDEVVSVVGLGVPGVVSHNNAFLEKCANINLEQVDLKKEIELLCNTQVFVDNDANVAAIAEYEVGSLKSYNSGILLTLGTGVGGGIIINGNVIRGSHGAGAEVGHMVVGENFYDCNCGRNGCLETFSSATGINKYINKVLAETNKQTVLRDYDRIDTKLIFDSAKKGDAVALDAVNRFVKYLAIGIVNFINILDPEAIALGGGVSHAGQYLVDLLEKEVSKSLYSKDIEIAELKLAELQNDAGIIGAGFMAKNLHN